MGVTRAFAAGLLMLSACGGAKAAAPTSPSPSAGPRAEANRAAASHAKIEQRFAPSSPAPTFRDPDRRKKLASAFPAIERLVDARRETDALPGLAFGLVIDGELALARGAGFADVEAKRPVDEDTVFRLGSITKTFTASALVKLRDRGVLSLDDAATRFIPELGKVVYPTRDAPVITLRHLAQHASGLPRMGPLDPDVAPVDEAQMMKALDGMELVFSPGADASYSNLGFGLLGLAVGRAAKSTYREVVEREIARPLGMTSLAWDATDVPQERMAVGYGEAQKGSRQRAPQSRLGAFDGAGSIFASLRDTARYVAFQLDAYPPRDAPEYAVLRRSSVRETHAPAAMRSLTVRDLAGGARGKPAVDASARGRGLAWHTSETCDYDLVVDHNGAVSGYEALALFLPSYGVGFVVLANARGGDLEQLAQDALAELAKTGGLAARRDPELPVSPGLVAALATYLAVQNEWNEAAYLAMLDEGHKSRVKPESEREETATYRARHGQCRPGPAIEVISPTRARFAPACDRGRLEMAIALADDGKIAGFGGTSFDLTPEPATKKLADGLVALANKWSDRAHAQLFDENFGISREEVKAFLARRRAEVGTCKLGAPEALHDTGAQEWQLECERGPEQLLTVSRRKADPKRIAGFTIRGKRPTKCPVR